MDFLKEIVGEELFNQIKAKVNAYNGDEANKDKQIKIANLASGEYVGKGKHDAILAEMEQLKKESEASKATIEELKKLTKDNESVQTKLADYEKQISDLEAEKNQLRIDSAIKVALLEAHAKDTDYLTFKMKAKESIELDEKGEIKGWNDKLTGLKTQFPDMFEGKADKNIIENKLQQGNNKDQKPNPTSLADALRMADEESND